MNIRPMTMRAAREFVKRSHRHSREPRGGKFALAVYDGARLCGVAIAGRPIARELDNGLTGEITRVCTDGTRNACSFLYAKTRRVLQAMGYESILTYNLAIEPGDSLRGAGFEAVHQVRKESWHRQKRPRQDKHNLERRVRWESAA